MASYIIDKKTGKPVLKSGIETPYQPDQLAAEKAPPAPAAEPQKESDK